MIDSIKTTCGYIVNQTSSLISLDTAIWLTVLAETIVLSWLVVVAAGAGGAGAGATWDAGALSTLMAGLVWVNLALGEFWKC